VFLAMSKLISLNLPAPPFEARRANPIEQRDGSLENPAVPLAWPVELEMDGLFGPTTDAGVRVSELIAMQNATVHACVRVRAESIGQLPLNVFERVQVNGVDGVEIAYENPIHDLLHHRPNPFMTSHTFRETMQACLDLFGNAYAVIERDNATRPIALWPRNPKKIKPIVVKYDDPNKPDELWYTDDTGIKDGEGRTRFWPAADMIHIVGLGLDGLVGLSPIKYYMKNAIGLAIAAEQFGARFYANNGRPGGVLIYKGVKLDPTQKQNIKDSWQEAQAGKNQGRPAVLTGDWDWKEMSIAPEEAQFLATRTFQKNEIAGMFRIPPHMIAELSRSTNNNIEQQSLEFVKYCLEPQIAKWQSELTYKLLQPPAVGRNAGRKFFVKFDTSEMVMGDFKTTMDALSVGLLNGTYSVNEARKKLNLNSIGPDGDEHTVQSQLTTLEALAALAKADKAQSKQDVKDIKAGKSASTPAPNTEGGDQPDDNFDNDGSRYSTLFGDAFNRVCTREKRDSDVVSKAFEPLLATIANDIATHAKNEFHAAGLTSEDVSKIVADQITAMTKAASEWKADSTNGFGNDAVGVRKRVVRSLRVAVFKEVAVQKAKE
jgi:HK97 family phage portal protein